VGEWREQRLEWTRPEWARPGQVACRLCGRPLFGRVWSAEVDGASADFCEPDCEALFGEYRPRPGGEVQPES
jgi:hypothetical protein